MLRNKRSKAARQREMRKRQPPLPGPGRPKLDIDPERVRYFASRNYTVEQVAHFLGCSPSTIRGRFGQDYEEGTLALNARLRMIMFELALTGNRRALMWEAKQRFDTPRATEVKKPRRVRPSRTGGCGGPGGAVARARAKPAWLRAKARKTPKIPRQVPQNRGIMPSAPEKAEKSSRRPWQIFELLL